ncbi:acyl carrier protein [Saccharopolyspora spinosa]|uniref:Polyketide biosynthesis acyl carrier protein n=1 Tax=Saccharopolyspora spinosa TaxID=60894 RepID=A0A2N3Y5I3_SACSN|nr:phosphopantetheine-binding protein [Saccharopolyspora spinosa]PKW18143.1 polyketide biosynthesis acyl carrier protein [Saccharopolyspora spinosa]
MTEENLLEAVRDAILRTLPELDPEVITPDSTLSGLGANSLDRVDILMDVNEALGCALTSQDLTAGANLRALVAALHEHVR